MRPHTQEAAGNIDTIKSLSGATDEQLGALVGVTGNGFSKRLRQARHGVGDLSIEQCARIARGFGLPLHVLFMPRAELLAWLAANDPTPQIKVDLTDGKDISDSVWSQRRKHFGLPGYGLIDLLAGPSSTIGLA